jgi:NTP pyrophosphatase (non-canonical NTP hydrolase)
MNPKEYVANVLKTETNDQTAITNRAKSKRGIRLIHAVLGLSSEMAEVMDLTHKLIDNTHLKEEMGDLYWYTGLIIDELQLDPNEIYQKYDFSGTPENVRGSAVNLIVSTIGELVVHVGEISDILKKEIFYDRTIDPEVVKLKLKQIDYCISFILHLRFMTSEQAMKSNIAKLKFRYPHKFTEQSALNRDLEGERKILEQE